jgi:predicted AAA+ superfamily ATPase
LLQENISQSLAGRIAYLQLLPLSQQEKNENKKLKDDYVWCIFNAPYPQMIAKKTNPFDWYEAYIQTCIQRDVRQLKNIGNLVHFAKLRKLCSDRTGQTLNLTSISHDGVIDQKKDDFMVRCVAK